MAKKKPPVGVRGKDKVPQGRRIKASIRSILEDVVANEKRTVREAVMKGIKGEPRDSHHFIKLAAEYLDGKPVDTIQLNAQFNVTELNAARHSLRTKLQGLLVAMEAEK